MIQDSFVSEDKIKAKYTIRLLLVQMAPFVKPYIFKLISILVTILGLTLLSRLQPYIIGLVAEKGIVDKNVSFLVQMAWLYLALQIGKTLLEFLTQWLFARFGFLILKDLREKLFQHFLKLPFEYFNKNPSGRITTRITNDTSALGDLFNEGVINIVTDGLVLISIVVAMTWISPSLAFFTLFVTPLFVWLSYKLTLKIQKNLRLTKAQLAEMNSMLAENINGMRIVQLYNKVFRQQKIFSEKSESYAQKNMVLIRANAYMHPVINLFNAFSLTIAIGAGAWYFENNWITLASLVAFIIHTQDFVQPMREILERYQQFQNSITSAERVFQVFDEDPEPDLNSVHPVTNSSIALSIKNLSFQYAPELPLVLKDLSLNLRTGESLAVTGRTGSGKSTLVSLLQRHYEVQTGSVEVLGQPIGLFSIKDLRQRVLLISQDYFIFKGSLLENIRLDDESIDAKIAQAACEKLGLWQELSQRGFTMESAIEERGANLSVGERQLISFARVLVFQPQVLILDEATANMDSQTESVIQKAITEITKGRTSIIIAHRTSTIQHCDYWLDLKDGVGTLSPLRVAHNPP